MRFPIQKREILLGIKNDDCDTLIDCINFIYLVAKDYIRLRNKSPLYFIDFQAFMYDHLMKLSSGNDRKRKMFALICDE